MKVKELFKKENLDLDFIESKFDGAYWGSCQDFIESNWDREIETFSSKQGSWFTKILDDCVEKRIEG